jgi:hypothetical protein
VTCLCGAKIENAKPVLELELESGALSARNTLSLCHVCLVLALTPTENRVWVFGLLPAEDADRVNRLNSDSTGEF